MSKKELVQQTKIAFDFIQKLYIEISYLIKEIEGMLAEEEESFVIGRPSGYQITSRTSAGLEPQHVNLWLLRKLATFFVAEEFTQKAGGVTNTVFNEKLKLIYLRIVIDEIENKEPTIIIGLFYDFPGKNQRKLTKFEQVMAYLEYAEKKVFRDGEKLEYDHAYTKFRGDIIRVNLYEINSSEDIMKLIITPILKLYREKEYPFA